MLLRQRNTLVCRVNGETGATGLEPATSGVTGVPKRFQPVSPSRRIGHIKPFSVGSVDPRFSPGCTRSFPSRFQADRRSGARAVVDKWSSTPSFTIAAGQGWNRKIGARRICIGQHRTGNQEATLNIQILSTLAVIAP